ncbi:MAG: putative baseplate assembly protein [Polyangiaceae bacterium]
MSRPPRFRTAYSTTSSPLPGRRVLDYLPDEFADMLDEERRLASTELGFPKATTEGDFAGTLMEIAALLGHTLGAYQDRYANDAFLGTARSAKSLVRHGRRLAYEPDPGLAATGYAVLVVKEGLSGTVARGLAIGSAPVGEKKAQDYETLEDLAVDAAFAEMFPADALTDVLLPRTSFAVEGTKLGLQQGDVVVVDIAGHKSAHYVVDAPVESAGTTTLTVDPALVFPMGITDPSGAVLWGKPAHDVHLFGWDTPSSTFSDDELRGGKAPSTNPKTGYTITPQDVAPGDIYADANLYLAEEIKKPISGSPGARIGTGGLSAIDITQESARHVTFSKASHVLVQIPKDPANPDGAKQTLFEDWPVVSLARTVTVLQASADGKALARSGQTDIRSSRWLLGFALRAPLVTEEPNPESIPTPDKTPVRLAGDLTGLTPGRLIALCERGAGDSGRCEIVRLTSVSSAVSVGEGHGPAGTFVSWEPVLPKKAGSWTFGELRLLGNVAPISHGKTMSEVLGDSDGSSPFLRFTLKLKPLTYLPDTNGALPELEIRILDVLWTRVVDFETSSPDDRHYLVQRDETGTVTVLFGDGQKGAIPPSGKKHITATYRVGIGPDGDAPQGAVSRLKKAHPLLDRAYNPLPMEGGAAPSDAEDVRTQSTGFIRTFDRAVSVEDHRQLALLYPGITKASSVWTTLSNGAEGVLVVVANADGTASNASKVEDFLRERRDNTVPLEVIGPRLVGLGVSFYLEIDPAYLKENVERAVRGSLTAETEGELGLFAFAARDLGQAAFLSEVYERVERAPGVRFIDVRRFDSLEEIQNGKSRVVDTVIARPSEVLVLAPQDIVFLPPEAK